MHCVCGNRKARFMKEQETKGILSSLGVRIKNKIIRIKRIKGNLDSHVVLVILLLKINKEFKDF